MNKTTKIIIMAVAAMLVIAAVIFTTIGLTSSSAPSNFLTGRYGLVSMQEGEDELSAEQLAELGRDDFYFEFFRDGTCVSMIWEVEAACTFIRDGDSVSVSDEYGNSNPTGRLDGDLFLYSEFGDLLVFQKQ